MQRLARSVGRLPQLRPGAGVSRSRFQGVFGKCEVELAAIDLVDRGLLDGVIEPSRVSADAHVREGYRLLVEYGWLVRGAVGGVGYVATPTFKERCQAAVARDRAEGITT